MVPESWDFQTVNQISTVASGGTPSRSKDNYWGGHVPWVTTAEVQFNNIIDTAQKITEEGLNNSSAKLFPVGTILVAMYGQGKTRGQVAILGIEASTNQACAAIQLKKGFSIDYYFQYFQSQYKNIRNISNSGGQKNLSLGIIKLIKVPVPPLPEQKKIAKTLTTWDKAITITEKLLTNSQQQKKALMQQLLTGKKRLKGFSQTWFDAPVSKMGKVVSGVPPDTKNEKYWNGDILWMTPTDVTALKTRFIKNTARKITVEGVKKSSATLMPAKSLLVCTRATIGLMSISETEITTNQGFKNIVPDENFDVNFLYYLFSFYKNEFIRYACGSTFLELSKKDFEKLKFICPEYNEQKRIAFVLSAIDKEIEILQQKLGYLEKEKKALMQQLLTGKRRAKVEGEAA